MYQCKALQRAGRHNTTAQGELSCDNSLSNPEMSHRCLAGLPRPSSCTVIRRPVIMATVMNPIAVCIFVAISIASLHTAEGLSHRTWGSLMHDIRQAGLQRTAMLGGFSKHQGAPGAEEALAALLEPAQAVEHLVPQEGPQRWHSCGHHPRLQLSPGLASWASAKFSFVFFA